LLCPNCNGDSFAEGSSFKTASEPILGTASSPVIVDLMSCKRCGADIPAVRGRRNYMLVGDNKLINSEMQGLFDTMARRSQSLSAEIERSRKEGELLVMEAKVAALKAQTDSLEGRKARLAKTMAIIASRAAAV
jgi:hypothetical protein